MLRARAAGELAAPVLFVLLTIAFGFGIVRDIRSPLLGHGDTNLWLHQADYLARHLDLIPFPRIDFQNDDALYPHGGNHVFRPWVFEAGYFHAGASHLFGRGPWLQVYYLLSVGGCALLAYLVVRREFGPGWGLLAGLALSFGHYPAVGRYPGHFSFAVVHWMTLSILLDLVILRRFVHGHPLTLRLCLLKCAALLLCFGGELGYVCGVALTSTLFVAAWMAALACVRGREWKAAVRAWGRTLRAEARSHQRQTAGLGLLVAVAAWLYVPLAAGVLINAHRANVASVPMGGPLQTSPLRIGIPVLPGQAGYNPALAPRDDFTDAAFDLQPGLFVVMLGLVGALGALSRRSHRLVAIPFVVLLVLFATYDRDSSLLHSLPWFTQARANNRFSVGLPVLFFCLILAASQELWRRRSMRVILAVAISVFALEATSAYSFLTARQFRVYKPDDGFYEFHETIARSPGEAVMEWPFCIIGGNGIGGVEFGAYYAQLNGTQTFQALHGKKIIGSYYGRIGLEQIEPQIAAGWPHLFCPDNPGFLQATQQARDFTEPEWEFVEQFVRKNDFCGLMLYTDLLPLETVKGFHQRFGAPEATTRCDQAGRMEFIRKPANWRDDVDQLAGRSLVYTPDTPASSQSTAGSEPRPMTAIPTPAVNSVDSQALR